MAHVMILYNKVRGQREGFGENLMTSWFTDKSPRGYCIKGKKEINVVAE